MLDITRVYNQLKYKNPVEKLSGVHTEQVFQVRIGKKIFLGEFNLGYIIFLSCKV